MEVGKALVEELFFVPEIEEKLAAHILRLANTLQSEHQRYSQGDV